MGQPLQDRISHGLVYLSAPHHEIHEGEHFFLSNNFTIGSGIGSSIFLQLQTPNTEERCHFVYSIDGNLVTNIKIWEGAILSGGNIQSVFNNNRNSTNINDMIIRLNPVISGTTATSGTLISNNMFGMATGFIFTTLKGGGTSRDNELLLKSGTNYLLQITSATSDNLINYNLEWYEYIDRS
jgi:hypothetical protein